MATQKKRQGQSSEFGDLRVRQLHIRLNDDEFNKIENLASQKRLSTAKFCRDKLLYEKKQIATATTINQVELLNQLHKIGVNLNQLAHRANKNESLNNLISEFIEELQLFKTLKKSQHKRDLK